MLNHSEFCQSFRRRGVMLTPQKTGREPYAQTQETHTALLLRSETGPEATALELIIELDRIGRIVREIERELSQWEASGARGAYRQLTGNGP